MTTIMIMTTTMIMVDAAGAPLSEPAHHSKLVFSAAWRGTGAATVAHLGGWGPCCQTRAYGFSTEAVRCDRSLRTNSPLG
uniref:Uncharacterized protein n=1 Tax=Schlesneria paludicola TaxID=360056 RepID=A0A7C4QNN0_9PLAN